MIDPELSARLDAIEEKAEKAYRASESVRKYLIWTGAITVALFVLPLIGMAFVIPMFLNSYLQPINAATGNTTSIQSTLNTLGL